MKNDARKVDRRKFLHSGFQAATGAAVVGTNASRPAPAQTTGNPRDKTITLADTLPARAFGNTGHRLPVLGQGTSAMVAAWAGVFGVEPQSPEKRVAMVRRCYEKGIRYFDTAPNYGSCESILGEALRDVRDNVYLSTKVLVRSERDVRPSVEKSLKQLQTGYLDCVQIHGPVYVSGSTFGQGIADRGYDLAMRVYDELAGLRGEGALRFIGLTGHRGFETMHRLIDTGGFDQVLLTYGYFRKGMDTLLSNSNIEWRELCLSRAHELGMGVVAMKVLGERVMGHNASNVVPDFDEAKLARVRQAALRWVLQDERVTMLLVGVSYAGDTDQNIETLNRDWAFTIEDRRLLAEFAVRAYQSQTLLDNRKEPVTKWRVT